MEESLFTLEQIFDLLVSAGYDDATKSDVPPIEKLAGGLAWCIAAVNSSEKNLSPRIIIDDAGCIDQALRSVGCPHPLQLSHIQNIDAQAIFPVIQWLVLRVRSKQEDSGHEVSNYEHSVEENEDALQEPKHVLEKTEISLKTLHGNLDELNHRKMNAVNELGHLQEKINKEGADMVHKLIPLMKSLKDLEKQENHFQSNRDAKHSELQIKISELEEKIANGCDSKSLSDGSLEKLDHCLSESLERLDLAKKELAARLRAVIAAKRQIDDMPCQSELIQYERRFSELYAHIQGKHRQTRKHYATYNALLEIKELMLKEISLVNSIISQFQEAFSSPDGRMKLVNSMEGIVKGSQQKLEKVQIGLREEERVRNDLKKRYAAAVSAQKGCSSLLKAFQEECAKNERLRCQSSN
ncbi:hypothetical protein L6164_024269 [Bauhinia variegata]|uniref:Uncharacterized protein n=1 Tax=Bauhinia variegata TaxID=167791 RepID=A0ACB9LX18_BAUVA|nr:hypothetical protein L6164_024269 [Bauhinia variegata]